MNDDTDFFTIVPPDEAKGIREGPKRANGVWHPVFDALGAGATLRVRVKSNMVGALSSKLQARFPDKRLASRKSDDPDFRYLWLVDR